MGKEKGIVIPETLFKDLIKYHIAGITDNEDEIIRALIGKVDRMENHRLYTLSKISPDEEEKELARKKYLKKKGIPKDYQW